MRSADPRPGSRVLRLAAVVLALSTVPVSAQALPRDPLEPRDPLPAYQPPAGGFDWSVPERFTERADGRLNWRYDETSGTYDPSHVRPTGWPVDFVGCQTQYDADNPTATRYVYEFTSPTGQRASGRNCRPRMTFPREATYQIRLRVTSTTGALVGTWTKDVAVKDLLVVSLGDSIASGEGAPEYPRAWNAVYGDWVDDRCHRSSFAGPAQAARQLEREDPKSSVTFLSFACSGATINRDMAAAPASDNPWAPFGSADSAGSGILGPYRGVQPPSDAKAAKIPAQLDQVKHALGVSTGVPASERRQIDALLLSAGGNDAGFGLLGMACLRHDYCLEEWYTRPDGVTRAPFGDIVAADLAAMPSRYDALAQALRPGALGLDVRGTFITEYVDPGTERRSDTGLIEECEEILEDVAWGMAAEIEGRQWVRGTESPKGPVTELGYARRTFLPTLNAHVADAAARHGWTMVRGISDRFLGHGYCVGDNDQEHPDRWIQTAALSVRAQGPVLNDHELRQETRGMLHPNVRGQQVYRDQILAHARGPVQQLGPDRGLRFTF